MKEYTPESIRNFAFIGHGGSGKTSLAEAMLYTAGEINRIGSISEGNTTLDYSPNEIERQFSISLGLGHLEWKSTKINLIDTPGYSDFVGEVASGVRVADTAVTVLKAVEGVEVGSDTTYKYATKLNTASAVIINKVDSERSDFDNVFNQAKERLSSDAIIITFPANEGLNFTSVVDVLKMKEFEYGEAGSKTVTEKDLSGDLKDKAENLRTELIEKIAELDEDLMNTYFENGELTEDEIRTGLKKAMVDRAIVPVFATSSSKIVGLNNFLDFAQEFFPSPIDKGAEKAVLANKKTEVEVPADPNGKPVMFIFKVVSEQHVGELSFFRVYSGSVKAGLDLQNLKNQKSERLSQLYVLNGHHRKEIGELHAGDIGAVVKLKDSHTNDTLATSDFDAKIQEIEFPKANIRGAIIPHAKGDEDKIANGLHSMHAEDPSFNVRFDPEISQTIISGQGELQLSLAIKRLKERYGVDVDLVQPKIPYREAIKGKVDSVEYKHKKQSGGRGQYGHVVFRMSPLERGAGFEFVDSIVGGVVPGRFIPAVQKGVEEAMAKGVLAGCRVVDVKVDLFFGSYHNVDSDEMSFKIAASQCFRKAFLESKPCILEPIYKIKVTIPEECMGDVMGDVSSRRGKILGMESDGHFQIINALVPLSELYKYSSTLRSLTAGRGAYEREFDHYEEVPKDVEGKIIEEYKKSKEEE